MTGDAKILKLSCIATLFVGIFALAAGVTFLVGTWADVDAWVTAASGVGGMGYGARSAMLANVPSNTSKIRTSALVALLVFGAALAYLFVSGPAVEVLQLAAGSALVVLALAIVVVASRIVKEQLRK